jgi:cyclophilin family peptidyl-prolyl cis-trans isomerase/outer membrane murein-binding lipoprotein Lpp
MKKILIIIVGAFLLAGCSSSEKLLKDAPHAKDLGLQDEAKNQASNPPVSANKQPALQKTMYQNPPTLTIESSKKYRAVIQTTAGDITVELAAKETPVTVNNFIFLAKEGFYDGTIFHRVIKDFMIQGGDPTGTGAGGPGYKFADESFTGEYNRGTLAMANAGPNTNGSQFFIMHKDVPLPKNYVIFGSVVSGIEAVDAIATAPVRAGGSGEASTPETPVQIKSISVQTEE